VRGWVLQRTPSRARVAADLLLPDGQVCAEGEAILVRPPQEFLDRWEPEKPFWRVYDD